MIQVLAHVFMVSYAIGPVLPSETLLGAGVGLMFIVIGNYLPKVRPNWIFGVRTPWTLTSELSWHRTHRLAALLFEIAGVAVLILAVARIHATLMLAVGIMIVVTVILATYSWWVWRGDSDRHDTPGNGIRPR